MGYCVNVEEVSGEEISPGVIKRVLLKPENTGYGPPGDLTVTHYTLRDGGVLTLEEPGVEYQDYIVSGSVLFGRKYIHGNTTIFSPSGGSHSFTHAGESEAKIVSTTYTVPHPTHKWCKTRMATFTEDYEQQLMNEEFHGLAGAHRFHAIDIQAWDREPHTNPEETAYFMRGTGEMLVGDTWYKVKPGSLVYSGEGETHAIRNSKGDGFSLQYYVMEYAEQDKMWSLRGHDPKIKY
jgi:mannose-6-phosphate isomerase-like protein (cupin superfamily)